MFLNFFKWLSTRRLLRFFLFVIKSPFNQEKLFTFHGALFILGALVTSSISFAILVGATPVKPDLSTTITLVTINLIVIFLLLFLIFREVWKIRLTKRQEKAASRLQARIVAMFALFAAIPAIMVAIVAAITLDIGLDRWFKIRTRTIIDHSLSIADSYVRENAHNLQDTTLSMAYALDNQHRLYALDPLGFIEFMSWQAIGRSLAHAALIKSDGSFALKANTPTPFPVPPPPEGAVKRAADGSPVLIEPQTRNIVGAIIKLRRFENLYLYTIRLVDPDVIKARQIVYANVDEYYGMEKNRITSQLAFALPYLSLALIIVLAAIWTGIALADRLVRPIRRLIAAAKEVSSGNLDTSVPVFSADGDVALLGDSFNRMILELKSQRHELLTAKDIIDERRRFSEAVLAAVTAGVIGVDAHGVVNIINPSAEFILSVSAKDIIGKDLFFVLPHLGKVFASGSKSGKPIYREQVTFLTKGEERTFNIRITLEYAASDALKNSYVITVDDITDLVHAQRSNAWADVARRIAHEIKNPLTPIQLSAERIRRRYGKIVEADNEVFNRCIDTIIRQVENIGRMVTEFSSFARTPSPEMKVMDLREPLGEASFLIEVSRREICFECDFGDIPLIGLFDSRLLTQAFGNIIKNAAEAIDACRRTKKGYIKIIAQHKQKSIRVDVIDNGKGFPAENRQKLLEPYVTTNEKGTGLGFAIIRKIIEEHGGALELNDLPPELDFKTGSMVSVILPAFNEMTKT